MSAGRPLSMASGRSRVSAFVTVPDAMRVLRFAEEAFDAALVRSPVLHADGTPWNAEVAIDDSASATGDMVRPGFLCVHVPDIDATFVRALAAGASAMQQPDLRVYGDRDGGGTDRGGKVWWIASHVEDPSDHEIARRDGAEEGRR